LRAGQGRTTTTSRAGTRTLRPRRPCRPPLSSAVRWTEAAPGPGGGAGDGAGRDRGRRAHHPARSAEPRPRGRDLCRSTAATRRGHARSRPGRRPRPRPGGRRRPDRGGLPAGHGTRGVPPDRAGALDVRDLSAGDLAAAPVAGGSQAPAGVCARPGDLGECARTLARAAGARRGRCALRGGAGPPRAAWGQIRPVAPMLLAILALQWIVADLDTALRVSGSLLAAMAVAALVALTTRMADMLDAVTRAAQPLRHVGVSPDRLALVLVLTIRAIPLLARQLRQVTEARKARGLGMSVRALVVPTVLGALTTADQLGDALAARGVDD